MTNTDDRPDLRQWAKYSALCGGSAILHCKHCGAVAKGSLAQLLVRIFSPITIDRDMIATEARFKN